MNDLYEDDVLLWSEQQAALLRRLAAGERVNEQSDWENVIDEVECVGSEQLHAVESFLVQALVHMLKAEAWPLSRDAAHGRLRRGGSGVMLPPGLCLRCGNGSMWQSSIAVPCGRSRIRSTAPHHFRRYQRFVR
jgi:hypothetical protein